MKTSPQIEAPKDIAERLQPMLSAVFSHNFSHITLLTPPKAVADDAVKLLVRDRQNRPVAVAKCSTVLFPDAVAKACELEQEAKKMLGPILGRVILDSLLRDQLEGRSYVVQPYCWSLSRGAVARHLQLLWLRPWVFRWLREMTRATMREAGPVEAQRDFLSPLERLARQNWATSDMRRDVEQACARLQSGKWKPKHVLAHNDLWGENILLRPGIWWRPDFVIIDWGGANPNGQAMYDLVRLAQSMSLRPRALRREIEAHCQILGCETDDGMAYLLSALGHLGSNLNEFPEARYVECVRSCLNTFYKAMKS